VSPSRGGRRVGWATLAAAAAILAIVLVGWTGPAIARFRALGAARRAALAHDSPAVQAALAGLVTVGGGDAEARLLLAAACRRLGQAAEARRLLEAAERAGAIPELVEIERLLQDSLARGLGGESARVLRVMLSTDHPESGQIFEGLFDAAVDSFAMTEAHALVTEWIERFPDDWYPLVLRGDLRARFHMGPQAAADYEAALRLEPDAAAAAAGLGDLLVWQLGRAEEAEPILRRAIDREPANERALVALAESLRRTGRSAEAIRAARRGLAIASDSPAALRIVAAVELEEGHPAAAVAALERADRASPGDLETVAALSRALAADGRDDEARDMQARAVRLRELAESLDSLLRSILRDPADAETRRRIGETMREMGRPADARRWLESAEGPGAR
jgi:predicted Zn-dependent protease